MKHGKFARFVAGAVMGAVALSSLAWAQQVMRGSGRQPGPCAPPPPPKRQAIASAEGKGAADAISQLPCAPTRRTEKKSPPAPPTLVTKISFGDNSNWQTDQDDVFNLLRLAHKQLNVEYTATVMPLDQFSFDPDKTPVLYFTGHYPFQFTAADRDKIRKYLVAGGTMVMDACCGSEDFYAAANKECRQILPGCDLRRLPLDHPIFWCYHTIETVRYSAEVTDRPDGTPYLEGVDLGCRTAIFVNKYDLSCGWDGHEHPWARQILPADAVRLGVNLMIYAAAARQHERSLADCRLYRDDDAHARGKVVLAQVKLPGEQDRSPAAVSNLLATLATTMPAKVRFAEVSVSLDDPKVFEYPMLYLTGHHSFTLTDAQVAKLRTYLKGGGFLVAEACCGRAAFDQAFRRQIARVLPDQALKPLSETHPIYNIPFPTRTVNYTPALAYRLKGQDKPMLEGITIGGATAVVYSRWGLSCGWQETLPPYALAYEPADALRLGVAVLTYGMSH